MRGWNKPEASSRKRKTDEDGVPPEDTKLYWVPCPLCYGDVKGVEYDGSPSGVRTRQIKGSSGLSRGLPICRQTDVVGR